MNFEDRRQQIINKEFEGLLTTKERAEKNAIEWILKNKNMPKQQLQKQLNKLYVYFKNYQNKKYTDIQLDMLYHEFDFDPNLFYPCLQARYNILKQL